MKKSELKAYTRWLRLQNKSENTIKNYTYFINKFPNDFEDIEDFLLTHRDSRQMVIAYRSYLRFKQSQGDISLEYLYGKLMTIKPPANDRDQTPRSSEAFPAEEWPRLIKNAPHRQAKMGIYLGLQFGLRKSEIIHLRVDDIDFKKNNEIHIRKHKEDNENGQKKWRPKSRHSIRSIPMNEEQANTLKKWIENRPDNVPHPYVIWNPHKKAKNHLGIVTEETFRRWCKKADPELTPHDLRRSYATHLYYATKNDVKAVQKALGHANIAVTSEYLRLGKQEYMDKIRDAMAS